MGQAWLQHRSAEYHVQSLIIDSEKLFFSPDIKILQIASVRNQ